MPKKNYLRKDLQTSLKTDIILLISERNVSMSGNFLKDVNIEDITNNLGIAHIYKLKTLLNKKTNRIEEVYEVIGTDIGFMPEDNIFISLKLNSGTLLITDYDFEEEEIAMNFQTFASLTEKYGNYLPTHWAKVYEKDVGHFYSYNKEKRKFERISDKNFSTGTKPSTKTLDILKMYEEVKKTIIAQDEQVKQILAAVYKNQSIINSNLSDEMIAKLKENIIVYGPTGTGKTEILNQLAKICNVPIVIEDITSFSETGYVGRDVSEMLSDLYALAGMDIEKAEKGILVIDEFDKLGASGSDMMTDGPSRTGVQRSLLKLLDGGTLTFKDDNYEGRTLEFNTSKLTIVALGAFSGIKKDDDYSDVTIKDFTDYGIIREVMGRFSKLVQMNAFSKEDIKHILLESQLSPINTYKKMFEEMGIEFTYDDELIDYIAEEAIALDCGARSLKTVFDGIINDHLFDVFAKVENKVHLSIPKDQTKSYVAKKEAAKKRNMIGFH